MVNKGKVSYYNTLEEKTNFKSINEKNSNDCTKTCFKL